MSAKTEHATHLFGAYFHQDCLQDDPDWESIVLRFRRSEPFDVVRTTRIELNALLERADESELEKLLFGPPLLSFYDPRPEGLGLHAWVEEIVHLLAGGSPRTSGRAGISQARRKAAAIARDVLTGSDPILAARELSALRFSVDVPEDDPDFTTFVAIDSETDALPVGPERALWAPEALARRDDEITDARAWANTHGRQAFESVSRRFDGADVGRPGNWSRKPVGS